MRIHPSAKRLNLSNCSQVHSHIVPMISDPKFYDLPTSGDGWALIGDAAGHVNAITGEGIYYAMMGGKLAAEAYIGGNIKNYDALWRLKYGADLKSASFLQKFFYMPRLTNNIIRIAKKSNFVRKRLYELIAQQNL
jgi:flavin-dependent dehydrogenase